MAGCCVLSGWVLGECSVGVGWMGDGCVVGAAGGGGQVLAGILGGHWVCACWWGFRVGIGWWDGRCSRIGNGVRAAALAGKGNLLVAHPGEQCKQRLLCDCKGS